MSDHLAPPMLRSLQGAACVVIIMWAIRTASHLVVLLLLDLTQSLRFPTVRLVYFSSLRLKSALDRRQGTLERGD